MRPEMTAVQARLIGCLMEKAVVTPDQYPLTLNALTNACNQKSGREPVMALKQNEVQRAARDLKAKNLVHIDENFKTGAQKYKQRLCNTPFNDFQLDAPQYAIVCLLLLRGAQTPGELRSRSARLHRFADNAAVVAALAGLSEAETDPVVVKLPRSPGRRDAAYTHQLCGPVDTQAYARPRQAGRAGDSTPARIAELEQRVSELEAENAALKARLAKLG